MRSMFYCLLIAYVSIQARCNKEFDCRGTVHNFEAFYKAYPDRDSTRVGDTIWFELSTPTTLRDLATGQMVDFSGAGNFGTAISFAQLTGGDVLNPGAVPAANDFDNVVVHGIPVQPLRPNQLREFLFSEQDGMYRFKLGIIPKLKGLFLIGFGDASNVYQEKDKCRKSNIKLTFKDTNQRIHLLEQSRPGYNASEYERQHVYCFRVY